VKYNHNARLQLREWKKMINQQLVLTNH